MLAGTLIYIPGAGTFTCIGTPPNGFSVEVVNSGDPKNAPAGTIISAGTGVSPASTRGPAGPAGQSGPQGPQGPQGASGTSVYTTLKNAFTIPASVGIAFVINAGAFASGQIVYLPTGNYFSIQSVDQTQQTLTLVNQNYPGGQTAGTVIPAGQPVSATGPQGPPGGPGPTGPSGPQGPIGVALTGQIVMYGAPTPPGGWLLCDGSAVGRTAYPGLFSIISTNFGTGDGSSTFNLPDLRGRSPVGIGTAASGTIYALGATGGEEKHQLLLAELAMHAHEITDLQHNLPDPWHSHSQSAHTHTGHDTGHQLGYVNPITNLNASALPQLILRPSSLALPALSTLEVISRTTIFLPTKSSISLSRHERAARILHHAAPARSPTPGPAQLRRLRLCLRFHSRADPVDRAAGLAQRRYRRRQLSRVRSRDDDCDRKRRILSGRCDRCLESDDGSEPALSL